MAEISDLLKTRENPQKVRDDIRQRNAEKLTDIESQVIELTTLQNELRLLLNLCYGSKDG